MKSKLIALAFISLATVFASAQDLIPEQNKKGKWGFVDDNGKKVIDYKYDNVSAFVDGRAKVQKGDKWGYIGTDGKEIIKIQYTEMGTWENGRCKVAQGGSVKDGLKGAKWGYIKKDGNVALKIEYDKIGPFEDGLAYVMKGGKYGYIDEDLDFAVKPEYSGIGKFNEQGYTWIATGGKMNGDKLSGAKMGVIKRNGTVLIKPEYARLGTFTDIIMEANPVLAQKINSEEGRNLSKQIYKDASKGMTGKALLAGFTNNKSGISDLADEASKRGAAAASKFAGQMSESMSEAEALLMAEAKTFDLRGYEMVEPRLFSTLDMSKTNYFAVSKQALLSENSGPFLISTRAIDKVGIIDNGGNVLLKPGQYGVAFLPSEGLIPVAKSSGKGIQVNYVNESGKLLLKKWLNSSFVCPFVNGVAIIAEENSQYTIDKSGKILSDKYKMILPQDDDCFVVKSGRNYGIIDRDGDEIVKTEWSLILPSRSGLYCARKEKTDNFGFINGKGKYVIEPVYEAARSFSGTTACVKNEKGWGVIGTDGKSLVECKWQDVLPVSPNSPNSCWVKSDGKWSHIDIQSAKPIFSGSYFGVNNFNENGHALVSSEDNLYGYIDNAGQLILPMRFSTSGLADECLKEMKEQNKSFISEIEAHRFNLLHNPASNGYRLSHTIDNSMWEY